MDNLIRDTADIIRPFSAALAGAFVNDPFRRVNLALAFAAGFADDPSDDIHPTASVVLQVAFADRAARSA